MMKPRDTQLIKLNGGNGNSGRVIYNQLKVGIYRT